MGGPKVAWLTTSLADLLLPLEPDLLHLVFKGRLLMLALTFKSLLCPKRAGYSLRSSGIERALLLLVAFDHLLLLNLRFSSHLDLFDVFNCCHSINGKSSNLTDDLRLLHLLFLLIILLCFLVEMRVEHFWGDAKELRLEG